jgi:hypothetical protein
MVVRMITAVPATITARSGQQEDVDALGSVFRERASHAQGFVIRMGENGHQLSSVHEPHHHGRFAVASTHPGTTDPPLTRALTITSNHTARSNIP